MRKRIGIAVAFVRKTLRTSIAAVLASLHRMGRVSWQDGRYALRLAA